MSNRCEKNKKIAKQIEREEKNEVHKSHAKKIIKVILILMILVFALLYYMRFIETKMLFVKESKIESIKIPASLSGLKIVQFSDLHYKMSTEEKELEKLVIKINELKPDVIVFTGDLLDEHIQYTEKDWSVLTDKLKSMSATISKYYVKGNHDYFTNQVDSILQSANFISLNNQGDFIYGDKEERIYINGMGSFLQNDFSATTAFENVDSNLFTISLFHEPDNILEVQDQPIDLALAGHSHNSQIRIPYLSNLFTVEGAKNYYQNYYQINNTHLYINAGIGTSIYRLRLFSPPTINLYRLVEQKSF